MEDNAMKASGQQDMAPIRIKATYTGRQPLVAILESNLDYDQVIVERELYEVKAQIPFTLTVEAPNERRLEEYVLKPMRGPVGQQWRKGVAQTLTPLQPVDLTIEMAQEKCVLEARLGTDHRITADIWDIVHQVLGILKKEGLLKKISRIRLIPDGVGGLLIRCYKGNRSVRMVDLSKGETIETAQDAHEGADDAISSPEDWMREQERQADSYKRSVEQAQQADAMPTNGAELVAYWRREGVIGIWADRTDITDSTEYARQLRRRAERRARD